MSPSGMIILRRINAEPIRIGSLVLWSANPIYSVLDGSSRPASAAPASGRSASNP